MGCTKCTDLQGTVPIRRPGDLATVIRVIRANIADGVLIEEKRQGLLVGGNFADLHESGPWPDHIQCHFRCASCACEFRLTAETYHGSGGSWERIGGRSNPAV